MSVMSRTDQPDVVTLLRPYGLVRSPAFSHVAIIEPGARTILVGGQNAVDADGVLVGVGDAAAQTARVLANLQTALAAAGATLADVVSWDVRVLEDVDLEEAFAVVARSLPEGSAPGLVSVVRVAGLAVPGALIEVSAVAAIPATAAPAAGGQA